MFIYVKLLGENVDVWRPVEATYRGAGIYQINEQPYDREIETWQFEPGERVYGEPIHSDRERILVTTKNIAVME